MNGFRKKRRSRWVELSAVLPYSCLAVALIFIPGCGSAIVSRRVPLDTEINQTPGACTPGKAGEGLSYYMPLGKIHIVAIRNETLVTNYGVKPEMAPGATPMINFISKIVVTTNTLSTTYSPTNFVPEPYAPTLLYSNSVTTLSNQYPLSQASSNITSVSNVISTTNFLGTNGVPTNSVVSTALSSNLMTMAASNIGSPTVQVTAIGISNAATALYPQSSIYSNNTVVTTTTEMPYISTNFTYTMTISADFVADTSQFFLLDPKLDGWHDDSVNVTIDANGLLSSVTTSNNDQTGNVIGALAQAGMEAFEVVASGGLAPTPPRECTKLSAIEYE